MGKPSGFMDYQRVLPGNRDPLARIQDWQEIANEMDEIQLQQQAARCMECGTPFCHTGCLLEGKVSGCPLHNLMPEWNDLVYRGLWGEAFKRLEKTNNFPEFTGHVCPAPCEGSCTAGLAVEPVTIKNLEKHIIEKAFAEEAVLPKPPKTRTGKKVAVIGSGPAGLACAAQLNKAGHSVTVFEREDKAGGLLMYGIPNMKLDKKIVSRRVRLLQQEGVTFINNIEVGKDYDAKQLIAEHDAVVLATGSTRPRDLNVPGRESKGIYPAVQYLTDNTKHILTPSKSCPTYVSAKGKDVLVIGGGDTGTDCVATALRQGAKSVRQFEIMPCPPKERAEDNPWPQYPNVLKVDYGQEEATAVFGEDPRQYCLSTKKFVADKHGNLKEVHTVEIEWATEADGRRVCKEVPGTGKVWPAQLVLLAMGFLGPEEVLLQQMGIDQDARSNIKAAEDDYKTNIPGVFAAGDARRGQSLVVWAIHEGRGAAKACDEYLMNSSNLSE